MSLRRKRLSPDFLAVPAEQPVPDEVRIADIDDRLTALAIIPRADRSGTWDEQVDRLLAMRNAIRPAKESPAPVVPGSFEATNRNYWESL